jgi:hypothetical protein
MSEYIRIDLSHRGYGRSMGNMLDVLSGNIRLVENWIIVEEREPGKFFVVNDNMTVKNGDWIVDSVALGFSQWDDEVEDLDAGGSDESHCFGMSDHLRWNDVDLTPYEYKAPSIERLKEAFEHVAVCAWCPGDI